jgi:hypothetical protein
MRNAKFAAAATLLLSAALAQAAVSPQEAARLGADLTPLGGEKAGNAAGTIPAWDGGLSSPAKAGFPVATDHTVAVRPDAVRMCLPAASNCATHTGAACLKVCRVFPAGSSHRRASPFDPPVSRVLPSGENAATRMAPPS